MVKKTTSKALTEKIRRLYTEGVAEPALSLPARDDQGYIRIGKVVTPQKFRWPELLVRRRRLPIKPSQFPKDK